MRIRARTRRNVTSALAVAALIATSGSVVSAPAAGRLSLDPAQPTAEESVRTRPITQLAESLLAGLLLASALGALAWLRSRQTRTG